MSSFQAWLYCYQYHPRLKDTWGALHREGIDTQWYGVCRAQWKPLCTSKTWRIKSGKKGKDQEQIVHGHPQRSVWQSWELSPNLPAQNLSPVHQAHTVSTEDTSNRAFSPFILLFAYRFFPLQVITPVCCIQNLLQIQEGNKPQSLWMFGNQSPEEKHCLWLNLHYSIKRKHTKSLLNEETVWVRTTFTKIRKWIAAVEGWATA